METALPEEMAKLRAFYDRTCSNSRVFWSSHRGSCRHQLRPMLQSCSECWRWRTHEVTHVVMTRSKSQNPFLDTHPVIKVNNRDLVEKGLPSPARWIDPGENSTRPLYGCRRAKVLIGVVGRIKSPVTGPSSFKLDLNGTQRASILFATPTSVTSPFARTYDTMKLTSANRHYYPLPQSKNLIPDSVFLYSSRTAAFSCKPGRLTESFSPPWLLSLISNFAAPSTRTCMIETNDACNR